MFEFQNINKNSHFEKDLNEVSAMECSTLELTRFQIHSKHAEMISIFTVFNLYLPKLNIFWFVVVVVELNYVKMRKICIWVEGLRVIANTVCNKRDLHTVLSPGLNSIEI